MSGVSDVFKAFEELSKAMKTLSGEAQKQEDDSSIKEGSNADTGDNSVSELLDKSGLIPRPPIVDPKSGALEAIQRFRQTIRWMLAAFAAVGLVVFGSLPFSNANEAGRSEAVLLVASLALAASGIAMAVWAVSMVSEPEDASLGELFTSIEAHPKSRRKLFWLIEDPRWRSMDDFRQILESDPAHVGPGVLTDLSAGPSPIWPENSRLPGHGGMAENFRDLASIHPFPAGTEFRGLRFDAGHVIPKHAKLNGTIELPPGSTVDGRRRQPSSQVKGDGTWPEETVIVGGPVYWDATFVLDEPSLWPDAVGRSSIELGDQPWQRSEGTYSGSSKAAARVHALVSAIGMQMNRRYALITSVSETSLKYERSLAKLAAEEAALEAWWKRAVEAAKISTDDQSSDGT